MANGKPHMEDGGDHDVIVFFNNRDFEDAIHDFLGEARTQV